jgi:hypothetical protein
MRLVPTFCIIVGLGTISTYGFCQYKEYQRTSSEESFVAGPLTTMADIKVGNAVRFVGSLDGANDLVSPQGTPCVAYDTRVYLVSQRHDADGKRYTSRYQVFRQRRGPKKLYFSGQGGKVAMDLARWSKPWWPHTWTTKKKPAFEGNWRMPKDLSGSLRYEVEEARLRAGEQFLVVGRAVKALDLSSGSEAPAVWVDAHPALRNLELFPGTHEQLAESYQGEGSFLLFTIIACLVGDLILILLGFFIVRQFIRRRR